MVSENGVLYILGCKMKKLQVLVVGAGFAGSVCAEQLASAGHNVDIIDRRPHIAGNAYDERDSNDIMIHKYGPHIFHTNSKRIFEYLSQFTNWRFYEHRVLADIGDKRVPIPINRTTLNKVYNLNLDETEANAFLNSKREPRDNIKTSEDVVINSVGRELCDLFFRGYTFKQWGLDLSELSAGVAARIPTRTNDDDRYFTDSFQFMPADGYTAMFKKMLDKENINLRLNTKFDRAMCNEYDLIIYTGPVDAFYDHKFGKLPYRSLNFEHQQFPEIKNFQEVGTVNYPNSNEFTRITEFKHLSGDTSPGTSIVREYPQEHGDPYYPIPRQENEQLYQKYKQLADEEKNVVFVGRLAQYRYYNMDQVVGAALKAVESYI